MWETVGIIYCVTALVVMLTGTGLSIWAGLCRDGDGINDDNSGLVAAGVAASVFAGMCWAFIPLFALGIWITDRRRDGR